MRINCKMVSYKAIQKCKKLKEFFDIDDEVVEDAN